MIYKKIFVTFFILISFSFIISCATTTPATREQMNHEFVVEYPGLTKDVIFERTMTWIANNFRSAKQVIEYSDKEAGILVGNGSTLMKAENALVAVDFFFTLNINIKEEKARYRFINLWFRFSTLDSTVPNVQEWHKPARVKFQAIVNNLKQAIMVDDDF